MAEVEHGDEESEGEEEEIRRVFADGGEGDEQEQEEHQHDDQDSGSPTNLFATNLLDKFKARKPFKMSLWETKVRARRKSIGDWLLGKEIPFQSALA